MKEEAIIHFVRKNAAIPAPVEPLLAIWLLVLNCHTWYRVEWLNRSCSPQADCVVCLSYSGHSIRGIWPVYFPAICSTLQPRKGPVRHSVSPFVWPSRMPRDAQLNLLPTASLALLKLAEKGWGHCTMWGSKKKKKKRVCGKESIHSWPIHWFMAVFHALIQGHKDAVLVQILVLNILPSLNRAPDLKLMWHLWNELEFEARPF